MSINENQEFEAINQKTSERNSITKAVCYNTEEIYRAKKAKAKKKAIAFMALTITAMALGITVIAALETIGWINGTFRIVLMCAAGAVAMFKTGYFWHEIKN